MSDCEREEDLAIGQDVDNHLEDSNSCSCDTCSKGSSLASAEGHENFAAVSAAFVDEFVGGQDGGGGGSNLQLTKNISTEVREFDRELECASEQDLSDCSSSSSSSSSSESEDEFVKREYYNFEPLFLDKSNLR